MRATIRRKVLVTGFGAAVVGVALLLNQLGIPFGLGPGSGEGTSSEPTSSNSLPEEARSQAVSDSSPGETSEAADSLPQPDVSEMLTVIVVGTGYRWGTNDVTPKVVEPISLKRISELAAETEGTEQGIRVRIFRAGSAMPSAELGLMQRLQEAGLKEPAILYEQRLLDLDSSPNSNE